MHRTDRAADIARLLRAAGIVAACVTVICVAPAANAAGVACQAPNLATPLDLAAVVDAALCNNPRTRQAWATVRLRAAQTGVADAALLPAASANASIVRERRSPSGVLPSPTDTRMLSLDANWVIYDFGARGANRASARALFDAAQATRDDTVQAIFLDAIRAFLDVEAAQATADANRAVEAAAKIALDAADARYSAGTATRADRLQARTAHAQALFDHVSAEGALRAAQGTLAGVMGLDPPVTITLQPLPPAEPGDDFEGDVAALIDEARRQRPDLAATEAQLRASRAAIDSARAAGRPTLSLQAGIARADTNGDAAVDSDSIGLALKVPLFTGFATTYHVHAAEAQADIDTLQRDELRRQVALDVWNAQAALATATAAVRSAKDLLDSATEAEGMATGRYKAGVGSILDALSAQSALALARRQRIKAGYDWYAARANLARALGTLDNRIFPALEAVVPTAAPIPVETPP